MRRVARIIFKFLLVLSGFLLAEIAALILYSSPGLSSFGSGSDPWWTVPSVSLAFIVALLPFVLIWRLRRRIF